MNGFFIVYSNPDEEYDIKCELHQKYAKNSIPERQQELYVAMESTNSVIKSLHNTKGEVKRKYFNKLLSLSQAGLVGKTAQPELALKSLNELKNEMILIEGQRIKNDYMKNLGIKAIILIGIILLLDHFFLHIQVDFLSMYFLTIIGALTGTWISFGARKFCISFEQLSLLEEDMMSPWIRLIYISVCSVILLLFLNTQLIEFGIGEFSTDLIPNSAELQVSIGLLCGLVESKIGVSLYKKAVTIISE